MVGIVANARKFFSQACRSQRTVSGSHTVKWQPVLCFDMSVLLSTRSDYGNNPVISNGKMHLFHKYTGMCF